VHFPFLKKTHITKQFYYSNVILERWLQACVPLAWPEPGFARPAVLMLGARLNACALAKTFMVKSLSFK
jgi:hypothetical protein